MEILIKNPEECTSKEIDAFQKLVLEGGEVASHGLRDRIEQAKMLILINDPDCVAVGAIKNPNVGYKLRVFEKAGAPEKCTKFNYELGWIYVASSARGQGLGHKLMQAVVGFLGDSTCYATTRENNDSMHHILPQYSFNKLGSAYPSNNGYSLVLYANRS